MEKEYIRTFSIAKLYRLIKGDTESIEVSPFETYKINVPFNKFCKERLPKEFAEYEKAWLELLEIVQEVEENAFAVGFKMAVNLIR